MARILVVDDDFRVLALLDKYLKHEHEVFTTEYPRDALDLYLRELPAVVISDIKMPDIDGVELMKKIKRMGRDVEIILMTGQAEVETAIEALRLGASDFLLKPIDVECVSEAIQTALYKTRQKERILGLIGKVMTSDQLVCE
jgi:DNA-binding NtrC family response regulator